MSPTLGQFQPQRLPSECTKCDWHPMGVFICPISHILSIYRNSMLIHMFSLKKKKNLVTDKILNKFFVSVLKIFFFLIRPLFYDNLFYRQNCESLCYNTYYRLTNCVAVYTIVSVAKASQEDAISIPGPVVGSNLAIAFSSFFLPSDVFRTSVTRFILLIITNWPSPIGWMSAFSMLTTLLKYSCLMLRSEDFNQSDIAAILLKFTKKFKNQLQSKQLQMVESEFHKLFRHITYPQEAKIFFIVMGCNNLLYDNYCLTYLNIFIGTIQRCIICAMWVSKK